MRADRQVRPRGLSSAPMSPKPIVNMLIDRLPSTSLTGRASTLASRFTIAAEALDRPNATAKRHPAAANRLEIAGEGQGENQRHAVEHVSNPILQAK